MLKSWIGRRRAGTVRPARVLSCAFVASFRVLLVGVLAAGVLWGSNPAQAQGYGKFYTKAIADDFARASDRLQKYVDDCDRHRYSQEVRGQISTYKLAWAKAFNKLKTATGQVELERISQNYDTARGIQITKKAHSELKELEAERWERAKKVRDYQTAIDGMQRFRLRGNAGIGFEDCDKKKNALTLPGFEYKISTTAGVGGVSIPTIGAGTVGNPGTEVALVTSDGVLSGASVKVAGSVPVRNATPWWPREGPWALGSAENIAQAMQRAQQFPGLQYQFGPRVNFSAGYGNLRGNASGLEPIGGRTSSFTYLTPNPATGTTGVNAGATGESVKVKTKVRMVDFDINYSQPLTAGLIGEGGFWVLEGSAGFHFSYSRGRQWVGVNSLTFPGVSSETELVSDDYFAGPRLGMVLRAQHGPFYLAAGAYFVPGFFISHGLATQDNLCDVCGNPLDRNFRLQLRDTERAFGVRTGVHLGLGVFLTDNILLGLNTNYSFISRMGGYDNTTSPTQQPARYDTNSAHSWGVSAQLKFVF